jgi:hypothetical protein
MAGNKYRFNQFDIIGGAGAEEDKYLSDCFIDTGYLKVLKDMSDCRQIILGRTGAGKSALLAKIKEDETETPNKKGLVDHLLGCFSGANKKDKQSLEAIEYIGTTDPQVEILTETGALS